MAYGNPFGGYGAPMYGYPNQMMQQPMPDQLAQLRGAQPYPMMQAQQPQAATLTQQNNGLIFVQGDAGAKGYLVAPGQKVLLFNSEGPSFYIKSADANGVPSMNKFDYTEHTTQDQPTNAQQYATHAELEALETKISAMIQQSQRAARHVKEDANDEQPAV